MFIFLVSTVLAWNNVLNTELLGSRFLMSVIKNLELNSSVLRKTSLLNLQLAILNDKKNVVFNLETSLSTAS